MKGKDCVAIASDLRYGIRLHTHGTNFPVSNANTNLTVGWSNSETMVINIL